MTSHSSGMNHHDTLMLPNILADKYPYTYNWTNCYILRFLNQVLGKMDIGHLYDVYSIYPEQVEAIYKHWGWSQEEINAHLASILRMRVGKNDD